MRRSASPSLRFDPLPLNDYLSNPQFRVICAPGKGQIYKITPLWSNSGSNGYVGQNKTSLYKRVQSHITPSSGCYAISNAIKKYGLSNFTIERLEDNIPLDQLNDAEIKWIAAEDSWHNGYNCGPGGDNSPMCDPDVKVRHKIATIKGHNTAEYLAGASARAKATHADPDFKAALKERIKLQHTDPVKKANHHEGVKKGWVKRKAAGNTTSISISRKKNWEDPLYRAKMKASRANGKSNSAAAKATYAKWTPEQRRERVIKGWATRKANKANK